MKNQIYNLISSCAVMRIKQILLASEIVVNLVHA